MIRLAKYRYIFNSSVQPVTVLYELTQEETYKHGFENALNWLDHHYYIYLRN